VRCASASLRNIALPAGVSRIHTSRLSCFPECLATAPVCSRRFTSSTAMLNEQSRGEFADRRFGAFRKAMYRKQQLMLLRLEAMLFRRGFAEMKELADLPAELGQVPVLPGREIVLHYLYRTTMYLGLAGPRAG
jgi:hypothetical protein